MKRLLLLSFLCFGIKHVSIAQWADWQKIVASDRFENDQFGFSSAISGDYAIVGAYYENSAFVDSSTPGYGAAYILKKGEDNIWREIKKLVASDRNAGDLFGISVSISGDYAIVGASGADKNSTETASGAAYIFYKNQGGTDNWDEMKKIAPDETNKSDLFGISVSISGNHVLIGAQGDEKKEADSDLEGSGSAYFYSKDQGGMDNWGLVQKVVSTSRTLDGNFGHAVAVSENYAVIGAPQEHQDALGENSLSNSGSAYVYQNAGIGTPGWQLIGKLEASDRQESDRFGSALAISDDYLVIGAPERSSDTGVAYVFKRIGEQNWGQPQKLSAFDFNGGDHFGYSVAIANDYLLIGAYGQDGVPSVGNWISSAGAAYLYQKGTDKWGILQKLVASDPAQNDFFGWSVAVSESYAFVGARAEDEDGLGGDTYSSAGSAYIFSVCEGFPCFKSAAVVSFEENAVGVVLDVNAINGIDGSFDMDITYSISGNDAIYFSIDPVSGVLTFVSPPDYENPEDVDSNNYYELVVTANGNSSSTDQSIIVKVTDKNENPIFVSEGSTFFEENQITVALDVNAIDGEGGVADVNISYSLSGEDADKFSIDEATGEITFTSQPDFENPADFNQDNVYEVIVTAENNDGIKTDQSVTISVTDIDDTPVVAVSASFNAFSTSTCSASLSQSFMVSGNHLQGAITVTAPDKIELSLDNFSFTNSIELIPTDGVVRETTVYVRTVKDAMVGGIGENISISASGVVTQQMPVDGIIHPILSSGWQQASKIVASDRMADDWFGRFTVAISDGYAIVGVERNDETGDNTLDDAGAAYIFKKGDQGDWLPIKKLIADDRDGNDRFGSAVSVSGHYAIVGASQKHYDYGGPDQLTLAGAAYIFKKDEGGVDNWGQVQKILASDKAIGDAFGQSVAIKDGNILVGAINEGSPGLRQSGAVYVFKKDAGSESWTEAQKIKASDSEARDLFGNAVAVNGNHAVIGAWNESGDAMDDKAGAAYIFQKDGNGEWFEVKKIVAPIRSANDNFGFSVAIREDVVVVGAYKEDEDETESDTKTDAGSAYLYQKNHGGTNNWGLFEKLVAGDRSDNAGFGRSVAIASNFVLVGSNSPLGGVVYVLEQGENGNWGEVEKITSSDLSLGDLFGITMAASDDFLIIGAPFEDEDVLGQNTMNNAGSAYIFKKIVNHAPNILSTDLVEFPENSLETILDVDADNGEGGLSDQSVIYSLSGGDAALFDIDINTGLLSFKSPPDFENPLDENADNNYNLVVNASDCNKITFQSISVVVSNTNDDPTITLSGEIHDFYSVEGQVSVAQVFSLTGHDLAEELNITTSSFFEISLDNSTFKETISIQTSGLGFEKSVFIRSSADAPLGDVTGNVRINSLGVNEQTLEFNAVVSPVNSSPVLSIPIENLLLAEGFGSIEIDLSGTFTDGDGDVLDFSVETGNEDAFTAELSQNSLILTEKGIGTSTVTVTASDGKGGQVAEEFQVVVAEILGLEKVATIALVYPNPTTGKFTLQLKNSDKLQSIEIFELNGKRIDYHLLDSGHNHMTLQIPQDVKGMLTLQFHLGEKLVTKKIMVR